MNAYTQFSGLHSHSLTSSLVQQFTQLSPSLECHSWWLLKQDSRTLMIVPTFIYSVRQCARYCHSLPGCSRCTGQLHLHFASPTLVRSSLMPLNLYNSLKKPVVFVAIGIGWHSFFVVFCRFLLCIGYVTQHAHTRLQSKRMAGRTERKEPVSVSETKVNA